MVSRTQPRRQCGRARAQQADARKPTQQRRLRIAHFSLFLSPSPPARALPSVVAPLDCMNRNARKPSPANHGARPNSSYNRKRASPEFGSWRHAGLRPGQTPAPRPQPGTPACVAEVAVLGAAAPATPKPAASAANVAADSKSKKPAATPQ